MPEVEPGKKKRLGAAVWVGPMVAIIASLVAIFIATGDRSKDESGAAPGDAPAAAETTPPSQP